MTTEPTFLTAAYWEERNSKAREIHNAAIRAQERAVKDYWLTFDAYKKTQTRIRFRCDYEDRCLEERESMP